MYTIEQAAKKLGVTISTVAQYVRRESLDFANGQITAKSLDAYQRRTIRNYADIEAALAWGGWGKIEARPGKVDTALAILKFRVEFKSQVQIAQEMGISRQWVSHVQAWAITTWKSNILTNF